MSDPTYHVILQSKDKPRAYVIADEVSDLVRVADGETKRVSPRGVALGSVAMHMPGVEWEEFNGDDGEEAEILSWGDPGVKEQYNPNQSRDAKGRFGRGSAEAKDEHHEPQFPINPETAQARLNNPAAAKPAIPLVAKRPYKVDEQVASARDDPQARALLPLVEIPLTGLYATQFMINPDRVFDIAAVGAQGGEDVLVVETRDGRRYVEDGQHRVSAAALAGRSSIRARVLRLAK